MFSPFRLLSNRGLTDNWITVYSIGSVQTLPFNVQYLNSLKTKQNNQENYDDRITKTIRITGCSNFLCTDNSCS